MAKEPKKRGDRQEREDSGGKTKTLSPIDEIDIGGLTTFSKRGVFGLQRENCHLYRSRGANLTASFAARTCVGVCEKRKKCLRLLWVHRFHTNTRSRTIVVACGASHTERDNKPGFLPLFFWKMSTLVSIPVDDGVRGADFRTQPAIDALGRVHEVAFFSEPGDRFLRAFFGAQGTTHATIGNIKTHVPASWPISKNSSKPSCFRLSDVGTPSSSHPISVQYARIISLSLSVFPLLGP